MKLEGGCHCGAVRYELTWPDGGRVPARRCGCDYCRRFDGQWTSHPDARLDLTMAVEPIRYRFGTATADFLSCARCGVVVAAIDDSDATLRAIVNVHTLDDAAAMDFDRSDSDFSAETREARLARRAKNWMGDVTLRSPTSDR